MTAFDWKKFEFQETPAMEYEMVEQRDSIEINPDAVLTHQKSQTVSPTWTESKPFLMASQSDDKSNKPIGSLTTFATFQDAETTKTVSPFGEITENEQEDDASPPVLEELTLGVRQRSTVLQNEDFRKIENGGSDHKPQNKGKEEYSLDTKELLNDSITSILREYGKLTELLNKQRIQISEIIKELGLRLPVSKTKPRNMLEHSKKKLKKALSDYGRVYSLICRNVMDGEDIFSSLDPNLSILVSEIRIC